jgi:hypothetical protein
MERCTPTQGRLNWFGQDPGFKDELGFRGPHDIERRVGEWNRIEVISVGDRLRYFLNGKVVNEAEECGRKIAFSVGGSRDFFSANRTNHDPRSGPSVFN